MSSKEHEVKAFGSFCKVTEGDLSQKIEEQCHRILEAVKKAQDNEKRVPSTVFQGLRRRELVKLTKTANTICDLLS